MYKNIDNSVINKLLGTTINEINKAGEMVLTEQIIPVTPLDKGDLRKSLDTKHMNRKQMFFYWRSRGNLAPYNLKVHEWLNPSPRWSEPGTGAKYIENPVINHAGRYMKKAIKRGLKLSGF
jgi:hypothetical protein